MDGTMKTRQERWETIVGLLAGGGLVAGFAGLLLAVAALLSGDWVGTGTCLMAAALAFGLLANAILRG